MALDLQVKVPKDAKAGAQPKMRSYKPVGALISGLAVLRHLSAARTPLTLTQIASDLQINPSTCLNILRTFAEQSYVVFDAQSKVYSIGLGVLELFSGAIAQNRDLQSIRAIMDDIAQRAQVTVTLWKRVRRDRIMLVMESLPHANATIKMNIGQRLPLLAGATGRLMAAYTNMDNAEIKQKYSEVRLVKKPSFRQFLREVAEVRTRGWSLDNESLALGTTSIGVPVLNDEQIAEYGFVATMFASQFRLENADALAAELRKPVGLLKLARPFFSPL